MDGTNNLAAFKNQSFSCNTNMDNIKASGSIILFKGKMLILKEKKYKEEWVQSGGKKEGNETPEVSYSDRKGKYMKQTGVTLPKV